LAHRLLNSVRRRLLRHDLGRSPSDATHRANRIWKQLLDQYEAPALDPAIDEALVDFVVRRRAALDSVA
jgi:trimethylamine:corrinoid methyltransferase-like protein